jgi:hypothetical protein
MKRKKQISPLINTDERIKKIGKKEESIYRGSMRMARIRKAKSQKPRAKSQEPKAKSQKPRAKSQEPKRRVAW